MNKVMIILTINEFFKYVINENEIKKIDLLIKLFDSYTYAKEDAVELVQKQLITFYDNIYISFKLENKIEWNNVELYPIIFAIGVLDKDIKGLKDIFFNIEKCYWYCDLEYNNNNIQISKVLNIENTKMVKIHILKSFLQYEFLIKYKQHYDIK